MKHLLKELDEILIDRISFIILKPVGGIEEGDADGNLQNGIHKAHSFADFSIEQICTYSIDHPFVTLRQL